MDCNVKTASKEQLAQELAEREDRDRAASAATKLDYIAAGYTNSAPITKGEAQFLRALLKFHQDYMRPGVLRNA